MIKVSNRARLMAGGAFAALAVGGYAPRGAYAGDCVGPNSAAVCSGAADAANDVQQNIRSYNEDVIVTTAPGFGINVTAPGSTALSLYSYGYGLDYNASFTDQNMSAVSGAQVGIAISGDVDQATIESNGAISGGENGIFISTVNSVYVDVNEVSSSNGQGIYAQADRSVYVSAVGDIVSGADGVVTRLIADRQAANSSTTVFVNNVNAGGDAVDSYATQGDMFINVTGVATSETGRGVRGYSRNGRVSISANEVSASDFGIDAFSGYGSGFFGGGDAQEVRYSGFSKGRQPGVFISAADVTGGYVGVSSRANYGSTDIFVKNVSGSAFGVSAFSEYDDISVYASGTVTATASSGTAIFARTRGDGYQNTFYDEYEEGFYSIGGNRITVSEDGSATGGANGIEFVKRQYFSEAPSEIMTWSNINQNDGGEVIITVDGDVSGGRGAGILVRQEVGGPASANEYGYNAPFFAGIDVNGSVSSDSGVAIDTSNVSARVEINEGAAINGDINFGEYSDTLSLNGATLTADTVVDGGVEREFSEPDRAELEGRRLRRFAGGSDLIQVTGDTTVVGANLVDFEGLRVGGNQFQKRKYDDDVQEPAVLRFADVDTLTIDNDGFYGGLRFARVGGPGRKAVLQGPGNIGVSNYGGEIVTGTSMTITTPGLANFNSYSSEYVRNDEESGGEFIRTRTSTGKITIGGTPGQSRLDINVTPFEIPESFPVPENVSDFPRVINAGLIDMQNGAAGDVIAITGTGFSNYGDIAIDISPQVGTDMITVDNSSFVVGEIDVNVIDANTLGRTEHVVISTTSGTITEEAFDPFSDEEVVVEMEGEENEDTRPDALTVTTDSVVADVDVRVEETEVIVGVTVNFVPEAEEEDPGAPEALVVNNLSPNATVVGETLNETINDPNLAALRQAALTATNLEELEELFQQLGGSDFAATISSAQSLGLTFGQGQFSCAVGEGTFAAIDEGQCGYTRISGTFTDVDSNPGQPGFDVNTFDLTFGGQFELDENIRLGGSIGYSSINADGDNGLDFSGDRIAAGVVAKFVDGPFMAGVSLSGGITMADTDRVVAGFGTASADFDSYDLSAIARVAYLMNVDDGFYVKPQLEGGITYVDREAFTEAGAGAANLVVTSETQTFFSLSPSVEIGGDFELENGATARPYLRVGATFLSEDSIDTTAAFAGAAAQPFTTTVTRDDIFADVAAGVTFFTDEDLSVRAEYSGRFSDDTMSHGGFLKLQINF